MLSSYEEFATSSPAISLPLLSFWSLGSVVGRRTIYVVVLVISIGSNLKLRDSVVVLWMLWDRHAVGIRVVLVENHFIHEHVSEMGGRVWELSIVYASPNRAIRPAIWEQLGAIDHSNPWLLIGDFNYTLRDGE